MTSEETEDFRIPEDALEKLSDPESVRKFVEEGMTFQELLGYDEAGMEKYYQLGCDLYRQGNAYEAADVFIFLTTLNPAVHNYWLALGMAEQTKEEYESALVAYSMALMTNQEDPTGYYHSAHCYLMLGDRRNAHASLDLAIEVAQKSPEHDLWVTRARASKERLGP